MMAMVKERYIWAAFFLVVIAMAVYFRFYNQPSMAISVSMQRASTGAVYPYEAVPIRIILSNNGSSAISNLTFGLYINGNVSTIYKASIPAGKQTSVLYNYTPSSSGVYEISMVADPGRLYNIADRQAAQANTTVDVNQQEAAQPYLSLPPGASGKDTFRLGLSGYEASIIYDNFTPYFYLTRSSAINNFIYPVIDVYSQYINSIAVSHGYYKNYSVASIWLSGYLSQNAIAEAAIGKGLNVSYDGNVSVIGFGGGTTMCAWYSGGWTKTVSSILGANCTAFLNYNSAFNYTGPYQLLKHANSSILNYSGFTTNTDYAGDMYVSENSIFYESLTRGGYPYSTCYGDILNLSGLSYCTSSILDGNFVVNQLTRESGGYNFSVWSVAPKSQQEPVALAALNLSASYDLPGPQVLFASAYGSKCFFDSNFTCTNPVLATNATSGAVSMDLKNGYNSTVELNSISCAILGNAIPKRLGIRIGPGNSTSVSAPCYNESVEINSNTPQQVVLSLKLNYTRSGTTNVSQGAAEIV